MIIKALKVLGALAVASIVFPWDVTLHPGPLSRLNLETENTGPRDEPDYTRTTLRFPSVDGTECEAWFYAPKRPAGALPPVVVMAHGLGGQKDMGLDRYAARFAAAGLASFVFDYRTFGGSDGEPRNWISPRRHLQDWRAALAYVRGALGGAVDVRRLALWGTSYGGGHALVVAGEQGDAVAAVVAQVPFLDGKVALQRRLKQHGPLPLLRNGAAALQDVLRTTVGLPPAYMRIAGAEGSVSMMQLDPHELRAYFSKHPTVYQGGWRNLARAMWGLEASRYRPIASVPAITAPVLYITAVRDSVCPPDVIAAAVAATRDAAQKVMQCSHFDVYQGAPFEEAVTAEVEFLVDKLGARTSSGGGGGGSDSGGGGGSDGGGDGSDGGGDGGDGGGEGGGGGEGAHEEL